MPPDSAEPLREQAPMLEDQNGTVDSPTRPLPSDFASLLGDLSLDRMGQPRWQVHDRTHLEFAVHYPLGNARGGGEQVFEWEAYFFLPQSLRIHVETYSRAQIQADLQSYIRLAAPAVPFTDLATVSMARLREGFSSGNEDRALRAARLFASEVRASGVFERSRIANAIADEKQSVRSLAYAQARRMATDARAVVTAFREAKTEFVEGRPRTVVETCGWIDEDISKAMETLLGRLGRDLFEGGAPTEIVEEVEQVAVDEARYRVAHLLDRPITGKVTKRQVEHLEYRRHMLKRFTSSALWLDAESYVPGRWVRQALYAGAASVAMAFAIVAALFYGFQANTERMWMWGFLAMGAYAVKDRIKAALQEASHDVMSRWYPDRRWRIRPRGDSAVLGEMDERSGMVTSEDIPAEIHRARYWNRKRLFSAIGVPETVLRHKKTIRVNPDVVRRVGPQFDALTEIFRLDIRRWLAHTDDPKREILFADPVSGGIRTAKAPRVYNIGVVYRLVRAGQPEPSWKRVRVVVSRKGIDRIEHVEPEPPDEE
ncbi:MAG: hypothetical protein KC416_02535 [Myxococcales bacterium]|nr:hypothetical protein [Myxococcales bacterium]